MEVCDACTKYIRCGGIWQNGMMKLVDVCILQHCLCTGLYVGPSLRLRFSSQQLLQLEQQCAAYKAELTGYNRVLKEQLEQEVRVWGRGDICDSMYVWEGGGVGCVVSTWDAYSCKSLGLTMNIY